MRLHKIIELLQNSLGNSEKTIFRIGINTEQKEKKSYDLISVADFEYHIYITFEYSLLSEISIYDISRIYDDSGCGCFKRFNEGLYPLGCEGGLLREAKTFKIVQIEDVKDDLEKVFSKMRDKHNEKSEQRKKERCVLDNLNIDAVYDIINCNVDEYAEPKSETE